MAGSQSIVPVERIERSILLIRGQKVMLDSDLADLYGVPTKALNQAVKRNKERFPKDFMFQLTGEEKAEVVTNCDHLQKLKYSPALPYPFTEHGAVMLANVIKSKRAIDASIRIVRAFVRLCQVLVSHAELARKLDALERKYDAQFRVVFDAIRELMSPEKPKQRQIGFERKSR
ncbi:MAG: ORF6N domain-containing protein [Candidatus Zixiibacteriota bacterium]